MAKKGLDTTFLHYGIRKEDITLIETLDIEFMCVFTKSADEKKYRTRCMCR